LPAGVSPLIGFEREVVDEFRAEMRTRLAQKIAAFDAALPEEAKLCATCGERMHSRGRRPHVTLTRYGEIDLRPQTFGCDRCKTSRQPLIERLGVEVGHLSGSLARLAALLGIVVAYSGATRTAVPG
jgi:hypothetical protein